MTAGNDTSVDVWDLLSRGYFPKELPPTFSTEEFASRTLGSVGGRPKFLKHYREAELCLHSFGRIGSYRRTLGIPNPLPFLQLCLLIGSNWNRINKTIRKSRFSVSYPVANTERAVIPGEGDLPRERARIRQSARYVAIADISRFYHSIYTHTIEWALHGKTVAKRRRGKLGKNLLGRRIDDWIRASQAGQSVGLPVGPDTSLIVAEIIGAALDKLFSRQNPKVDGLRFMDDFEFPCKTASEGSVIIGRLQECLSQFELGLNHSKTRVDVLPAALDEEWKREVRLLELTSVTDRSSRFIWFFDGVIDLAVRHPGRGVIGYAISRMRTMDVSSENWGLFQDVLLQLSAAEPSAFPIALSKLAHVHKIGEEVDRTRLAKFANSQIVTHADLGHANEVAWLIWSALVFELQLSAASAKAVSRMTDSVVALSALHAQEQSRFERTLNSTRWRSMLSTDGLYGSQWLQVYECGVKGWLKSPARNFVGGDASFAWLRDVGVEFYDASGAEPIGPSGFEEMMWLDELDAAADMRARHYGHGKDDLDLSGLDLSSIDDDESLPF